MATEKSDAILNGNKKRAIGRHGESLKETIAAVNKLRLTVEARKFPKKQVPRRSKSGIKP